MRIVLDTSAAIVIVLEKPGWEALDKAVQEAEWVEAPDLLVAEAANVFWKHYKFGGLSKEKCEKAMERAVGLADELIPGSSLYREAFSMACLAQKPAYDMFFLVLARRNNATLVSADKELLAFAAKHDVNVLRQK
jgi:predicted nucleic acid-binding protein